METRENRQRQIMLATDGSLAALKAAAWVNDWIQAAEASITIVTVITPTSLVWSDMNTAFSEGFVYQELMDEEHRAGHLRIEETRKKLRKDFAVKEVILRGPVAETLIDYAKQHHVSLIVVGRRGHSVLGNLLGSISFSLIQRSAIPVTIVG
ncbi:MAG: universal stress protein [Firmicutes bacterium]|nr:universal stress protein [Bacillota bacterium]